MGAATAWQLAQRGARVLGLDRLRPPHVLGSSHGGTRIIRETAFEGAQYVPLVRRAYDLWAALEPTAAHRLLIPTGGLYAGPPGAGVVAGSRASAEAQQVPTEDLDAEEIRRRFPAFEPAPGMVGLFERRAGVLRPEACHQALLAQATHHGADLRFEEPMLEWRADGGDLTVRTAAGSHRAGALVLALGPWMPTELALLGVRLEVERVVQHWFAPARDPHLLEPTALPVYIWEDEAGVVFYGFPMLDGVVKCAIHHRGEIGPVDGVRREVSAEDVERTRLFAARFVPPAAGAHVRSAVCVYTNTPDGHFIVDRHPEHERVVLASPCNGVGFKFAPAVGAGIAALLLGGAAPAELAPFGLSRLRG